MSKDKEIFDRLRKNMEDDTINAGIESTQAIDTVWYVETNGDIIELTSDQTTGEIVRRVSGGVGTVTAEDLEEIMNEDSFVHKEIENVA